MFEQAQLDYSMSEEAPSTGIQPLAAAAASGPSQGKPNVAAMTGGKPSQRGEPRQHRQQCLQLPQHARHEAIASQTRAWICHLAHGTTHRQKQSTAPMPGILTQ